MDLIDTSPMRPGWGRVWQGGEFSDIDDIPEPRIIVSMVGSLAHVDLNLSVYINDRPDDCLPDRQLFGMVDATIAFLKNGINVYCHCLEGKSRSSYLNCAIHMRALNIPYDDAIMLIREKHSIANPNIGFVAQLKRLEDRLRNGS